MAPVLVLQHQLADGPSYLARWLERQGLPMVCLCAEAGDALPDSLDGTSALAVLGGSMSANDPWPRLRREEELIREAMARGLPTIGHCLGGQLMARALGAAVVTSPAPEIGWQALAIDDHDRARHWFGERREATVFHWHFEAFGLPIGAARLASSPSCPCQAFSIGPHLAMQFHVEVDAEKIRRWVDEADGAYERAHSAHPASVQSRESMLAGIETMLWAHQRLADRLYERWLTLTAR